MYIPDQMYYISIIRNEHEWSEKNGYFRNQLSKRL